MENLTWSTTKNNNKYIYIFTHTHMLSANSSESYDSVWLISTPLHYPYTILTLLFRIYRLTGTRYCCHQETAKVPYISGHIAMTQKEGYVWKYAFPIYFSQFCINLPYTIAASRLSFPIFSFVGEPSFLPWSFFKEKYDTVPFLIWMSQ